MIISCGSKPSTQDEIAYYPSTTKYTMKIILSAERILHPIECMPQILQHFVQNINEILNYLTIKTTNLRMTIKINNQYNHTFPTQCPKVQRKRISVVPIHM